MNQKCSLPAERCEAILGRFASRLTEEEEQQVRQRFPQYLFFRNEYIDSGLEITGPVRMCTCTACGESFEAVRGNDTRGKLSNEKCNCPQCGAEVIGKAVSRMKYDMPSMHTWIKAAVARADGAGGILIEAGEAVRRFNKDELEGWIEWFPMRRYYFGPEGAQQWQLYQQWLCNGSRADECTWQTMQRIGDAFSPAMYTYDGRYSVIGLTEAVRNSTLRWCQIERFFWDMTGADLDSADCSRYMVKYLGWACQYPTIEMAVKLNLHAAVFELIEGGKKNARYLNWSGTTPAELMRMTKQDAKAFMKNELDFADLKACRDDAQGESITNMVRLMGEAGGKHNLFEVAKAANEANVPVKKAVRYIRGLQPQCARNAVPIATIARTWGDYLRMAKQLGYDLSEGTVRMPKDLQERHDSAASLIRWQSKEQELKRYKDRRKKLEKKYRFALGDLCVLIPTGPDEIVQEGQTLHHCVGGYAERHVQGKTTILFIRHRKKPGRSFLTVELNEGVCAVTIRQIHGYRNERYGPGQHGIKDMQQVYAWFLEPWLEWVNSGSRRDKAGNPILPESEKNEEVKTA